MFCKAALHPHRFLLVSTVLVLGGMSGMGQVEMSDAGTLEGTVHYLGSQPVPQVIKVAKDQDHCGMEVSIQTVRIHDAHGALSEAVVSVEGIKTDAGDADTLDRPVLNMQCAFSPRVSTARQGEELEVRNQDPILHNTHIKYGKRTFLNVAQVPGGKPIIKRLKRPGLHSIRCDKHVFMQAYLHVFPHSYYAQTYQAGTFRITDIPPGRHPIRVWHETLGVLEKIVGIPQEGTVRVEFAYP